MALQNYLCFFDISSSPLKTTSSSYNHQKVIPFFHHKEKNKNRKLLPNKISCVSTSIEPHQHQPKQKQRIWLNPSSSRAPKLLQQSYHARYGSLIEIAESLNSCKPTLHDVSLLLTPHKITLEHDAVIILNNCSNPLTAPFALTYFLSNVSPSSITKDVILFNVTFKVFTKSRHYHGVDNLFQLMLTRGVQPDNLTFSSLISCARMSSLPSMAVHWFEKMPHFGCTPDHLTYSAMIDAYGRAGNPDMALSLYDRATTEKWPIDPLAFSTVIRIYSTSGNFDGCLNVYEEMKALGVKPTLVIYNTLLDAMGRAKRPWQTKSLYREMTTTDGLLPNRATYAALLRAFARARYGEDTLAVYKQMKEKGMELNVVLYNTLLAMCADVGFTDEAVGIFEDMKSSSTSKPDSWTFSSLITIYSCSGKVAEAEGKLNEMVEAGFKPNIFVFTSLIQCYGKANRVDDVVRTFDRILELGINPDERFCGCLLNVMTQTAREELGKLTSCIEKANPKLGHVVKLLVEVEGEGHNNEGELELEFKRESALLFGSIGVDVKKAYCNCLIDLCVNLNMLERACELLDLGLSLEIYRDIQSKTESQWSLHLKSLSLGAAFTALHVWMNDLSRAIAEEEEEEFPSLLGINTGHGKHKYSDRGLAGAFESHLKELDAPFHEVPDKAGWFITTKVAAKSWLLESRKRLPASQVA